MAQENESLTLRDVLTRASRVLADRECISLAGAAELVKDLGYEQAEKIAREWKPPVIDTPAEPIATPEKESK